MTDPYRGIYVRRTFSLEDRLAFYSMPEPNSGCYLWLGYADHLGYGRLRIRGQRERLAHRWAWIAAHGAAIPDGLHVMHKCDNPSCINPSHLQLGTRSDNMRDMANKGRCRAPKLTGEANASARLNAAQVREILSDSRKHRIIAAQYGVGRSIVGLIKNGKRWKHLIWEDAA